MRIDNIVERVLANSPQARNDDKEFLLECAEYYGLTLSIGQREAFKQMPSLESLTRIRRKVQKEGRYQASDRITRARRFKSLSIRQRIPGTPKSKMGGLLEEKAQGKLW